MVRGNFWPYSGVITSKGSNVMGKRKLRLVLAGWPFRVTGRCRKWRQERNRTWANWDTVKKVFLASTRLGDLFGGPADVETVIRVEINEIWEIKFFDQVVLVDHVWAAPSTWRQCLERRSDDDALSSTSLADRDVTKTPRTRFSRFFRKIDRGQLGRAISRKQWMTWKSGVKNDCSA